MDRWIISVCLPATDVTVCYSILLGLGSLSCKIINVMEDVLQSLNDL